MQALNSPAGPTRFFGRFGLHPISSQRRIRHLIPEASKEGDPAAQAEVSQPAPAWRQLRLAASPVYTPASTGVQSWGLGLACFLAAAASITTFNLLAGQIAAAAASGGFQVRVYQSLSAVQPRHLLSRWQGPGRSLRRTTLL